MAAAGVGCGVLTFISALPPNILQLHVDCLAGRKANTLRMPARCGCLLSAVACGVVAVAQAAAKEEDG